MKKWSVPLFCLLHMFAVLWWTLPHSFSEMVLATPEKNPLEARIFKGFSFVDDTDLGRLFEIYIDLTGNQQYWDFFAPQSPKFHQYLSVCDAIVSYPEQGAIACKNKPFFSNLNVYSFVFKQFDSNRSRLYRLTENLVNLEDPLLFQAFAQYYRTHRTNYAGNQGSAQLVLHRFELHPELNDLPKAGYRMDKLLWTGY